MVDTSQSAIDKFSDISGDTNTIHCNTPITSLSDNTTKMMRYQQKHQVNRN